MNSNRRYDVTPSMQMIGADNIFVGGNLAHTGWL